MNLALAFLGILLFFSSLFMILLILVQRGKGGGLTGALGGMGGQSAFGSKAGDLFTRITVVVAIVWISLCMVTIKAFNRPPQSADADSPNTVESTGDGEADGIGVGGESDLLPTGEEEGDSEGESGEEGDNVDADLDKLLAPSDDGEAGGDEAPADQEGTPAESGDGELEEQPVDSESAPEPTTEPASEDGKAASTEEQAEKVDTDQESAESNDDGQ